MQDIRKCVIQTVKSPFIIIFFLALIAFVFPLNFLSSVRMEVFSCFQKIHSAIAYFSISSKASKDKTSEPKKLNTKIERLKAENARLLAQLSCAQRDLRKIISYKKRFKGTYSLILAKVFIDVDFSNFRKTIVIDKGSKNGVVVGMPVVDGINAVGKVVSRGKFASRVQLITDPDFNMRVVICRVGDSHQPKIAEGIISGTGQEECLLRLDYIPKDIEVKIGDIVLTSSNSIKFPGNFLVGKVCEIGGRDWQDFHALKVAPLATMRDLRSVILLKSGTTE